MSAFLAELQRPDNLENRPIFRRVFDLCADIESSMRNGFSRAQIVQALRVEGIDITEAMLSSYLHRIRKIKRAQGPPAPSAASAPAAALPEPAPDDKPAPLWPF